LQAEGEAKRAGAGIWRGEFTLPGSGASRIVGANPPSTVADYDACMDTDIDERTDDPFQGLVLLMRIFWGPMFWPIIIGNVLAYLWCVYQAFV
jgi:hypothetical protein